MTYLQFMTKVLEFSIKEPPNLDYYDYWNSRNITDEEWIKSVILELMYLLLSQIKNTEQINPNLLKIVQKHLTGYDISFSKTWDVAIEKTIKESMQDVFFLDAISSIDNDEFDDDKKDETLNDISINFLSDFERNFAENTQRVIISKPMDNCIFDVITLIPELFFTKRGYKYIPEEYRIDDDKLREKLYYYIIDTICSYRCGRIDDYGRKKFGIQIDDNKDEKKSFDEFDDDYEEELDNDYEEDYGSDEWVIDTQFTGYSGLYHSIKLLNIVLGFIKNKQYEKLKKFIKIDEYIKRESEKMQGEEDKYTLVEILYDTRSINELNLDSELASPCKGDYYLDFFLNNKNLSSTLTDERIGRLILYYFDIKDNNSLNEIKNRLETLEMRRIPRPTEKFADDYESIRESMPLLNVFHKDDAESVLLNAHVMSEERTVRTVVFDDDDESYIPDCVLFDYYVCDCKSNLMLTELEEWIKLYEADKPIIFINTSYMFKQFEIIDSQKGINNGINLWIEFFIENYKKFFWLKDKSKFIFIMSKENSNKVLEYQCNGLIGELRPTYLFKNKKKDDQFIKQRIAKK